MLSLVLIVWAISNCTIWLHYSLFSWITKPIVIIWIVHVVSFFYLSILFFFYFSDEEIRSLVFLACTVSKAHLLFVRLNIFYIYIYIYFFFFFFSVSSLNAFIRQSSYPYFQGEITLEQLKKKGDAKLRGKEYQKGFAIYSIALNCPIMGSTDVTIIAEQLYRKRAECLFKMVNHS